MPSQALRLRAEDAEDLSIISAATQDAVFLLGHVVYDARTRRFVAEVNRYMWEADGRATPKLRIRSAICFEDVLSVRSRRVRLGADDAVAVILGIAFKPGPDSPAGEVSIMLAGDGEVRLQVECIDASLTDMGEPWLARSRPDHERA
jgi:hypothetical protein